MPARRISIRALFGAVSLIAALGLWAAPRANALSITMTGSVSFSSGFGPGLVVGDPVSLFLYYNPAVPPDSSGPGFTTYVEPITGSSFLFGWSMTAGSLGFGGVHGSITVRDEPAGDSISFNLPEGSNTLLLALGDSSGTIFSDTSLPSIFPSFSSFDGASAIFGPSSPIPNPFAPSFDFVVTGISGDVVVASIPAPAASGLLALGALGLAAARRRRSFRS